MLQVHMELQVYPELGPRLVRGITGTLPPLSSDTATAPGSQGCTQTAVDGGCQGQTSYPGGWMPSLPSTQEQWGQEYGVSEDLESLQASGLAPGVADIIMLSCIHSVVLAGGQHAALWGLAELGVACKLATLCNLTQAVGAAFPNVAAWLGDASTELLGMLGAQQAAARARCGLARGRMVGFTPRAAATPGSAVTAPGTVAQHAATPVGSKLRSALKGGRAGETTPMPNSLLRPQHPSAATASGSEGIELGSPGEGAVKVVVAQVWGGSESVARSVLGQLLDAATHAGELGMSHGISPVLCVVQLGALHAGFTPICVTVCSLIALPA